MDGGFELVVGLAEFGRGVGLKVLLYTYDVLGGFGVVDEYLLGLYVDFTGFRVGLRAVVDSVLRGGIVVLDTYEVEGGFLEVVGCFLVGAALELTNELKLHIGRY